MGLYKWYWILFSNIFYVWVQRIDFKSDHVIAHKKWNTKANVILCLRKAGRLQIHQTKGPSGFDFLTSWQISQRCWPVRKNCDSNYVITHLWIWMNILLQCKPDWCGLCFVPLLHNMPLQLFKQNAFIFYLTVMNISWCIKHFVLSLFQHISL